MYYFRGAERTINSFQVGVARANGATTLPALLSDLSLNNSSSAALVPPKALPPTQQASDPQTSIGRPIPHNPYVVRTVCNAPHRVILHYIPKTTYIFQPSRSTCTSLYSDDHPRVLVRPESDVIYLCECDCGAQAMLCRRGCAKGDFNRICSNIDPTTAAEIKHLAVGAVPFWFPRWERRDLAWLLMFKNLERLTIVVDAEKAKGGDPWAREREEDMKLTFWSSDRAGQIGWWERRWKYEQMQVDIPAFLERFAEGEDWRVPVVEFKVLVHRGQVLQDVGRWFTTR